MEQTRPRISFWTIAVLGLIWNVMGCLNFVSQSNPDVVAQMPETYQNLIAARAPWGIAAFGLAVFAGAVGCILLLLRRRVAQQLLTVSLIAVGLTVIDVFLSMGGQLQLLIGNIASLVVASLLYWMARLANRAGWMR